VSACAGLSSAPGAAITGTIGSDSPRGFARQILGADRHLARAHDQPLGHVLQLADVAGPLIPHQQLFGLGRELGLRQPMRLARALQVVAEQQEDVVAALAQGRNRDLNDVQR
jgi:hypothetical protein